MAKKKKNNKIIQYKPLPWINIGTFMFLLLFIYMIICLIMYVTTPHITAYEVTAGGLSNNYQFTALAVKTEKIIKAPESGTVNYYVRDGGKVGNGKPVCSISEGSISPASETPSEEPDAAGESVSTGDEQTSSENNSKLELDSDALNQLQSTLSAFSNNYSGVNYQNTYNFKTDIESTILDLTKTGEADTISIDTAGGTSLMNVCTADTEGIVLYSVDGYEDLSEDQISAKLFLAKDYTKENLRLNSSVTVNQPLYKILTDETWSLYFPLEDKVLLALADKTTIRVRFAKDKETATGRFTVIEGADGYYGKLTFSNSLIRYADDRFVDIELMINTNQGLKIPTSSIVQKEFYLIPEEFALYNEDEDSPNEIRVLKEVTNSDGESSARYITATVYDQTEEGFLVDISLFEEGDTLLMSDSNRKYTIEETQVLQGVYNINKGYTVFREISIIDENEEFCIVERGTSFGLSQFDHIVLDASTVNDDAIIVSN